MEQKNNRIQTSFYIDEKLLRKFKIKCAKDGISQTDKMSEMVINYVVGKR